MTESVHAEPSASQPEKTTDFCRPFLSSLPISGVSVTVITLSGTRSTVCSSDAVAARIDELQFELGEGPQWSVARSGEVFTAPDVASGGHDEWPVLGAALRELAVGALYCVPIRMGAVTLGAATLYCAKPLELTLDQITTALGIASAIAGAVVHQAMFSAEDEGAHESASTLALRREVHQATGVILVQLNTSATIAFARLQAYAFAKGRTVQAVAHDVVTGRFTFDETTP